MFGAIVGAVAGLAGGILQNRAAKKAASKQMDFQRETRADQYQVTMADMKKAGLNPILAYQQGGSGTLGGSSYTPSNVGAAGAAGAVAGATSAKTVKTTSLAKKLMQAQIDKLHESGYADVQAGNVDAQRFRNVEIERHILKEKLIQEKTNTSSAKNLKEYYDSDTGKWLQFLDKGGRSINPFIKAR